ncbi:MAG: NUDIX domain-containing protein [Candidatus Microsaccharimonas sossegonensis]|uniref:NUDIX domain-containing protein n=1 Tax=Candidatus Microsaccharimonas sossegonensis TaxID=2506948 RepID=A0A4Q0AI55_9BACT|nr:MAG: NUDIX domain-containing protein [Candidatus Microsaccharimonas sossegonensis]
MYVHTVRFRDLRPPKSDTNLFSYHLNKLVKNGLVLKVDGGYTLNLLGLSYVDRVGTKDKTIQMQPKIITMLLIQNSDGDILLQRRIKQPYIHAWTLPYGTLGINDPSIILAAKRAVREKLRLQNQAMRHIGDCYIRVQADSHMLSTTLAHIFKFNCDDIATSDTMMWARPHKLREYVLAPAVEEIVSRGFFNDPFFFEEFDVSWSISKKAS